jgi:hypothetical protein
MMFFKAVRQTEEEVIRRRSGMELHSQATDKLTDLIFDVITLILTVKETSA